VSLPVQRRRTGPLALDCGRPIPELVQSYTLAGRPVDEAEGAVVVLPSLTSAPDPTRWWPGIVGPGRAVDTNRYAVLCPALLGSAYGTGPLPRGTSVTPRDMARAALRLLQVLGLERPDLVTGGSVGGMVALEWAATDPGGPRSVVAIAAPAAHTAMAIGHNHVQREAIRLGGIRGLAVARMAAMLTYRTPDELAERFGRDSHPEHGFQLRSYLEHQGRKLADHFDPVSYLALLDAMDAHDVGRGRGGVARALGAFQGDLVGVGIRGDILYPPSAVKAWVGEAGARYREFASIRGHDGFLIEEDAVSEILSEALEDTGRTASVGSETGAGRRR
jgi:homoserine O-acetyltransferase/O-succinyltransferase